jgi:hypothetical protein
MDYTVYRLCSITSLSYTSIIPEKVDFLEAAIEQDRRQVTELSPLSLSINSTGYKDSSLL